jgi:hypothetical protein
VFAYFNAGSSMHGCIGNETRSQLTWDELLVRDELARVQVAHTLNWLLRSELCKLLSHGEVVLSQLLQLLRMGRGHAIPYPASGSLDSGRNVLLRIELLLWIELLLRIELLRIELLLCRQLLREQLQGR